MRHVMIDLETLGVDPDCAFISIGACFFNPATGDIGKTFYRRIDWESALEGRTITPSTLKWWMTQEDEARQEILKDGRPLKEVLNDFANYLGDSNPIVWGNGATFDVSILTHAYNGETRWPFWDVRDVRTVVDLAAQIDVFRDDFERRGVHHNALDDAIYQAEYVSAMWVELTRNSSHND